MKSIEENDWGMRYHSSLSQVDFYHQKRRIGTLSKSKASFLPSRTSPPLITFFQQFEDISKIFQQVAGERFVLQHLSLVKCSITDSILCNIVEVSSLYVSLYCSLLLMTMC
jgi:hypothetical protein